MTNHPNCAHNVARAKRVQGAASTFDGEAGSFAVLNWEVSVFAEIDRLGGYDALHGDSLPLQGWRETRGFARIDLAKLDRRGSRLPQASMRQSYSERDNCRYCRETVIACSHGSSLG